MSYSFLNRPILGLWLIVSAAFSAIAVAEDYSAQWGPAVGKMLPVLEAPDQSGRVRTLDNLTGKRGLLLFLNRSTDW